MPARLVTNPRAYVYTKNQAGAILDLTPWVTSGEVQRLLNQASNATVTLRNPERRFTTPSSGVAFHPMDPITIYLERIEGKPVQVFTGYLDTTPYYQLYPGTITLTATCTLKRLLYTWFDPSLPYVISFFTKYGWLNTGKGSIINPNAIGHPLPLATANLQDSSIGKLLWATLYEIGDWHDSNIYIENLPDGIGQRMQQLMSSMQAGQKQASDEFTTFLNSVVGAASQGSGAGTGGSTAGTGSVWSVRTSSEADNSGPVSQQGAGNWTSQSDQLSGHPASYWGARGWTELSEDSSGQVITPLYSSLGPSFPRGQLMDITYNGKTITLPKSDNGTGSPFGPAIGLTHAAQNELGITIDSNPTVTIQLTGGGDLSLRSGFGTLVSQPKTPVTGVSGSTNAAGGKSKSTGTKTTKTTTVKPHVATKASGFGGIQSTMMNVNGKPPHLTTASTASSTVQTYHGLTSPFLKKYTATLANTDRGVDFGTQQGISVGDQIVAIGDCYCKSSQPFYGGSINPQALWFELVDKSAGYWGWYVAEQIDVKVSPGSKLLSAGTTVATFASAGTGIEIGWAAGPGTPATDAFHPSEIATRHDGNGTTDGRNFLWFLEQVGAIGNKPLLTAPGGGGGGATGATTNTNTAEAFVAELQFPSIEEQVTAIALGAEHKGLMHDQQLLPFVQQLTQASLRTFQSLPNGDFYAFYPDYFGEFGNSDPYWLIDDIELLDGGISLSDDSLATHVFAVGDNTWPVNEELLNMLFSAGNINIFNAFLSSDPKLVDSKNSKNNPFKDGRITKDHNTGLQSVMTAEEAVKFIERYGARPLVQNYPMVHSNLFEMLLAYQQFMYAWANQFKTPFTFTFMPELYPGGKVGFPNHGIQMYINSVTHSWSYEDGVGFTTTAELSAPSVLVQHGSPVDTSHYPDLPPNMVEALVEPVRQGPAGSTGQDQTLKSIAQSEGNYYDTYGGQGVRGRQ